MASPSRSRKRDGFERDGFAGEPPEDCATAGDVFIARAQAASAYDSVFRAVVIIVWPFVDRAVGHSSGHLNALVQPRDRVESREHGAFLPGVDIGGMLTRERDAAVDRTQVLVVLFSCSLCPGACAAERPRHSMPGDRYTVLVFGPVLGVNLRAVLE